MKQPKILLWDIESTGLNATFGTVLCIGYKFLEDKKPTILSILKTPGGMLDDSEIVRQFVEVYNTADYHVQWYGDGYDLPMIRSKMIKYGMDPLPPKPSLDLYKTAKRLFKLHSNRLAVWQDFLKTENSKTPIDFDSWLRAAHGDKKALAEVHEHCRMDVMVLEQVFLKMRPWLSNEPARALTVGDPVGCPSCGSNKVQKRGTRVTKTRKYQLHQCQSCGKWWSNKKAIGTTETSTAEG